MTWATTAAMPLVESPSPRRSGRTHTPCTWAAYGVTQAISALKTTPWSSKLAIDQPRPMSCWMRAR